MIAKYLPRWLAADVSTPLYRSAYYLMFSGGATSVLGFLYWVVAARLYSPEVVGLNSSTIAAIGLISTIGQLSLNGALVRFVPVARRDARRFVGRIYLVIAAATVLVSVLFFAGLSWWFPQQQSLVFGSEPLGLGLLVASTLIWALFNSQDHVLTGLRRAFWVAVENTGSALGKIVLLLLFANQLPQSGIIASSLLPAALTLLPINYALFRFLLPRHVASSASEQEGVRLRQIVHYTLGNYPGTLFITCSTLLLPLLVNQQLGAKAAAYFYLPWMVTTSLQTVSASMGTALTVEGAHDQSQLGRNSRRALVRSLQLIAPATALLYLGAALILHTFGAGYAAEGTELLQLLALATIPNILFNVAIGLYRAYNRSWAVLLLQGCSCVLTLGLSAVLLPRYGIAGVGYATLATQLVLSAGIVLVSGTSLGLLRRSA